MSKAAWPVCLPANPAGCDGGGFDRREELREILHRPPQEAAKGDGPPPSRWTLARLQGCVDWLEEYSPSGIWYLLQDCGMSLRSAGLRQWSPDPEYEAKLAHLVACLKRTAAEPKKIAFLFWDQMGFYRWPTPTPVWEEAPPAPAPQAHTGGGNNRQWRLLGCLNAWSGRVDYLDNYIVGRRQVIEMYQLLNERYQAYEHIYVAQDNWSIHQHADVLAALQELPKVEPVFLPTYSPWLNPIEKLWRWLRQTVLNMHRLAEDWPELLKRVRSFLNQFSAGSEELLHYVGLRGEGRLARAIAVP